MAEFRDTVLNLTRAGSDLSLRQLTVLLLCHECVLPEERQVKALAEAANVVKPVITRAADKLQEHGLIARGSLPTDRRSCFLTLTKDGTKMVEKMLNGAARRK